VSSQLDILALEPFYGGARKAMLETLFRYSRHRWTLLKLPPRSVERRLAAAAQWFAEQLSRHLTGHTDVLVTSETMNLADLFRLAPTLAKCPSVVYFHDNQLPRPTSTSNNPLHLVNLNTAQAASEIWFNSLYHLRAFLAKATAMVQRYEELSTRNPLPDISAKARLMLPPIDFHWLRELDGSQIQRDSRALFLDTRAADLPLLNSALGILSRRAVHCRLLTVGPVEGLSEVFPRRALPERDELAHIAAMFEAGIHLSVRLDAAADHHALRALFLGCWPIFPKSGVYPELLPASLHGSCLYEPSANALANRLHDAIGRARPLEYAAEIERGLSRFEAISACKAIDQRLEQLAAGQPSPSP